MSFRSIYLSYFLAAATGLPAARVQGERPVIAGQRWPATARLAQVSGLTTEEGKWLFTGLGTVAFGLGIAVAIKKLREQPHQVPLEVKSVVSVVEEPVFQKFVEYVHTRNHDFATQINHLELAAEERRLDAAEQSAALLRALQELGEKLDGKRSASIANLHQQLKSTDIKVAAVAQSTDTHTQQLHIMDQKLTNLIERMGGRGRA